MKKKLLSNIINIFIEELAVLKYKYMHTENTALFRINREKTLGYK